MLGSEHPGNQNNFSPCNAKGEECVAAALRSDMKFPLMVEQGYHMGTVSNWGPTFDVSFDLKINAKSTQSTGVFQMIHQKLDNDAQIPFEEGVYKPAVLIKPNSSSIQVICNQYWYISEELPLAEWTNVRMTTTYCSEGNLFFKLFINGAEVYNYQLPSETSYDFMEVYAGSPMHPAAMAEIDNFSISQPLSLYLITLSNNVKTNLS